MKKTLSICLLFSSLSGYSYDFSAENSLFAEREKRDDGGVLQQDASYEKATEARKAYEQVLTRSDLTEDERVYASSQMFRLDLFRGGMLEAVNIRTRQAALDECIAAVKQLESTGRQEYYYYKMACMASRGKISDEAKKFQLAKQIREYIEKALDSSKKQDGALVGGYEGGGVLRIYGAVKGNLKARPLQGLGMFDPADALVKIDLALATRSMENPPFPAMTGQEYFENAYYKGMAQITLGVIDEQKDFVGNALDTLDEAITTITDLESLDSLPKGREPETRYYKGTMIKVRDLAKTCLEQAEWTECLVKALK